MSALCRLELRSPSPHTNAINVKPESEVKPHAWIAAFVLLCAACALGQANDMTRPFDWVQQPFALPEGVKVYEGTALAPDGSPIHAWYADVDLHNPKLRVAPYLSTDAAGQQDRQVASAIATKVGAVVAINGGYFDVTSKPARTFSLVRREGVNYADNIGKVTRPGRAYYLTRSALGFMPDGSLSFAWVHDFPDGMRAYPQPITNSRLFAAPDPLATDPGITPWNPVDAIGGGPRLLEKGVPHITYDEEVFFGSGFGRDNPYPRAAVGLTRDNHLILFTTDGKQPTHSIGLSLAEVAQTLQNLDCVEAMNLDGGGSETLVVNGIAVNKPSDANGPRPVTSILAVVPR